ARARGETEGVLADWRRRFDRVIVVTASDELKILRYAAKIAISGEARAAAEADARARLARQIPDAEKAQRADYVIENSGDIPALHAQADALWLRLAAESNNSRTPGSLK
ncbi:MAG TPA: dephospho-CoA kinase, partial [Terracidiphilus sp.]|nr:dephospho-CoA kinase [Terracidiphilus sp.]